MSGNLAQFVGLLARCCLWLVKREASRDRSHFRRNPDDAEEGRGVCMCEACQWRRGVEADGDELFTAKEWR